MTKDKDRDLIDRMNSALTQDLQQMLEEVFDSRLKQIFSKFDDINNKLLVMEVKINTLEKDQKNNKIE